MTIWYPELNFASLVAAQLVDLFLDSLLVLLVLTVGGACLRKDQRPHLTRMPRRCRWLLSRTQKLPLFRISGRLNRLQSVTLEK